MLNCADAIAQQNQEGNSVIRDLIEEISDNLTEDQDLSELIEILESFQKNPIDLNNTNAAELKSIAFLTPFQINNFFSYLQLNGKFLDILELQSVDGFDLKTIERLSPFITLNKPGEYTKLSLKNLSRSGNHDLIIRYGQIVEKQKGFNNLTGSRYLGSKDRLLTRYRYNYGTIISAALTIDKDAGERFIGGPKQYPFDFISGSIMFTKMYKIKKLVIGDYAMQYGQGLTLWSGFAFGKGPDIISLVRNGTGLKSYTSSDEHSFFKGVSATVQLLKNLDFTPFISFRKLDASISNDSNGTKMVTSVNVSGLHRTLAEINNKNTLSQKIIGGSLQYNHKQLALGIISLKTGYQHEFTQGNLPYRMHDFKGNKLINSGLYYSFNYKNIYLFGELATSSGAGNAFINGALVSLTPSISANASYRRYDKDYHNFYNQGLSESGRVINESGFYTGLNIIPNKRWTFSIYGDYFKFPWLKFGVDAPSAGYEMLSRVVYTPDKYFKMQFQYKMLRKQENTDIKTPINYLDGVRKENYRAELSWKLNHDFSFHNRIEYTRYQKGNAKTESGYLIYKDIKFAPLSSKISANLRIGYFNIPSYSSRIYAYENDVLYSFNYGMYNGRGIRNYFNVNYKIIKPLTIWARYAVSIYNGTQSVGTGLDEIQGNKKTDIKLQLHYLF